MDREEAQNCLDALQDVDKLFFVVARLDIFDPGDGRILGGILGSVSA